MNPCFTEIVKALEEKASEQCLKIYKNHGATGKVLGVKVGDLKSIQKAILKQNKGLTDANHALAIELWESKIAEAQILACELADPNQITHALANKWVKMIGFYMVSNYFSGLIAKSPCWEACFESWSKSETELTKHCGYDLLSTVLKISPENVLSKKDLAASLKIIEQTIHGSPNRARNAMNNAIIAIGVYSNDCYKLAMETAEKVGEVFVDHGKTACKTPDAAAYIIKTRKHYNYPV